jgi:hypothetical protein
MKSNPDIPEREEEEEPKAFVEKKRKKRMSLKLDEEGIADISALDTDEKSALVAAMMMDDDTKGAFGGTTPQSTAAGEGLVSADDVRRLMQVVSVGEAWLMPKIIKSRTTVKNNDGTIRVPGVEISPAIAVQAFTFPDKVLDKMCPLGAQAANEHLPESIRVWISKTGPTAEFFGLLILAIHTQMQTAIVLQRMEDARAQGGGQSSTPSEPSNGTTATGFSVGAAA